MAQRERMASVDAAWLHMDRPTNLMINHGLLLFDEPLDWDRLRRVVADRMVAPFPRFHQRVVGGGIPGLGPWWEDDADFDLDHHLRRVMLPEPGDDRALADLLSGLLSQPLDPARPLWEILVVYGLEGGGCAYLPRVHHCIADGIALALVLFSMTDLEPEPAEAPAGATADGVGASEGRPGLDRWLVATARRAMATAPDVWREAVSAATSPSRLVELAQAGQRAAGAIGRFALPSRDAPTVLRTGSSPAKRAAWSEPIPLAELKAAGRSTGSTINDVILTAVTGAIHLYLTKNDDAVPVELGVLVPFNLRQLDQPLPPGLGNRFGLTHVPLPVGLTDRAARLSEVRRRTDAMKRSPEGVVSFGALSMLGTVPQPAEQLAIGIYTARASAIVTNVPGPQFLLHLAGTPVRRVIPFVPTSGDIGLGVDIFSYNGDASVGITADAAAMPDPETLVDLFSEEIAELRAMGASSDS